MKVRLKDGVDKDKYHIPTYNSIGDYLKIDQEYEVCGIEVNKNDPCCISYSVIFDYRTWNFDANIFVITDNTIGADWVLRQINESIFMLAPKCINYLGFVEEFWDDELPALRAYYKRFDSAIKRSFLRYEFRKIFNDYQDPSIKATGVDTQTDGYVVCPHCYNAEQVSAELGVIKCEKCQQEYNNPLAKICPSGIEVVDE